MRLIDADAAIDALCKSECGWNNAECRHKDGTDFCVTCDNVKIIKSLPSAQPKQRWIPVTERLPEEHEWVGTKRFGTTISDEVYVTFEAPDGQRFTDHISFQNGKLSASDAERMRVWYKGAKPVAWMPLPEPYQEGGEADE